MITIFDRKKLYEPNIAEAIKSHNFDLTGLDPLNGISVFHTELDKTLRDLKVIRVEKPRDSNIFIPNSIKRVITLKRQKDKAVKKGLAPMSELEKK